MPAPLLKTASASPGIPEINRAVAPMSSALVVVLLALMLGAQPVTTDLYLAALPAITESLSAPMSQAQLTLNLRCRCMVKSQTA